MLEVPISYRTGGQGHLTRIHTSSPPLRHKHKNRLKFLSLSHPAERRTDGQTVGQSVACPHLRIDILVITPLNGAIWGSRFLSVVGVVVIGSGALCTCDSACSDSRKDPFIGVCQRRASVLLASQTREFVIFPDDDNSVFGVFQHDGRGVVVVVGLRPKFGILSYRFETKHFVFHGFPKFWS